VAALPFEEGSWVQKGQVLALLDDSELSADVMRAEAVRDQQRTTYERWKSVVEQKAGAQQDLDDAEARYKIAEADLSVARVRLSKTRIAAPFSGNVGARRVSVGAFVHPGDPITVLASTDVIRVTFSAPERFVPELRRGSSVAIGVTAYPGQQWFGRIDVVDPVLNEATRSVQILARVPNQDGRLHPGMSASVSAVLAERRIASDQVAEMTERERVAAGWIVRIDRAEILPDQKRRSTGNRNPELGLVAGPRKRGVVGAAHAQTVPFRVRTHRPVICEPCLAGRHSHLTAPGFAASVISALEQVACRAGEGIVRLAERRCPAVAVVVDAHVQPNLRHPLRVAHRAGP